MKQIKFGVDMSYRSKVIAIKESKMAAGRHLEFLRAKINQINVQFYDQQNKSNLVSKEVKFNVDISNN